MENYNKILEKLLSFKSISTSAEYKSEIENCSAYLSEILGNGV